MDKTRLAKVQGHDSLVRDMSSHAIIAHDDIGYEAYRRSRESAKKQQEIIKKQVQEIESLKNDMQEIKSMLSQLIRGN